MEDNTENGKLSFLTKMKSSVQGIKHYDNVFKETVGNAVLYLLLISLLLGSFGAIRGAIEANRGISEFIKIYNDEWPNFELKNGELSVDGDMPIVFTEGEDSYFVIDTTNKTNPDVLDSHSEGALILKDKIIRKKSEVQTEVTEFKSLEGVNINKNLVNSYLPFANVVIPFIFLGNMFGYFMGGLFSALFLALFALIINGIYKTKMKYGQLYSLSIYALTTPLIIDTLFKIFNIEHFSNYSLVYHTIAFVYIGVVLKKLKNSQQNVMMD